MKKQYVATWQERVTFRAVFEHDDLSEASAADRIEAVLSAPEAEIDDSDGVDLNTLHIDEVKS